MATQLITSAIATGWLPGKATDKQKAAPWQVGGITDKHTGAGWSVSGPNDITVLSKFMGTFPTDNNIEVAFQSFSRKEQQYRAIWSAWSMTRAADVNWRTGWGAYSPLATDYSIPWDIPGPADLKITEVYSDHLSRVDEIRRILWGSPGFTNQNYSIPWGKGAKPWAPRGTRPIDPWLPPIDPGTAAHITPVLNVYWIMNIATVSRLPERTPLNFGSIKTSIDVDSWGWRFSGVVKAVSVDLIRPVGGTLHEIEIIINGNTWVMIVESVQRNLAFGSNSYTVTGRSKSAVLADPHAEKRTFIESSTFTGQQLAERELTNTGWAVNWNTVLWSVPGGTWSYTDLTPIQAVDRIAQSVGAIVQSDPELQTLHIDPRYPISPWNWSAASPNFSIPMAVVIRLSDQHEIKPAYNAVVVTGQNAGVTCNVSRQGSAGDKSAPMVVEQLNSHQDAGRERGRIILGDTGQQSIQSLEMPLATAPAEPQLIKPLNLVEISEPGDTWKGQSVGVQVSAAWSGDGLKIRQTVQIERHHD